MKARIVPPPHLGCRLALTLNGVSVNILFVLEMQENIKKVSTVTGTVVEALPNTLFRVSIEGKEGGPILAFLAGKMRLHRIRVLVGDRVEVMLDPYGGKGRIMKRF